MINLRKIANRAIQCVNPNQKVTWKRFSGYTKDEYFRRVPNYEDDTIMANIQALSTSDLQLSDGLNLTGIKRKVWADGLIQTTNRADGLGGDILVFPEVRGGEPKKWLAVQEVEPWNGDWCSVIVVLQKDGVDDD